MKNWFEELMSRDQRRPQRYAAPRLVAYFWDGSTPTPHCVRDISVTGMYLLTPQRWYPGTLVTMILQRTDTNGSGVPQSIAIQARVVRSAEDGVAFRFAIPRSEEGRLKRYIAEGVEVADVGTISRFVSSLVGQQII